MSNITELKPNQVFVFGSNEKGQHIGGAALQAYRNFGATYGLGEGMSGKSYAIPTLGFDMKRKTLFGIKESLERLSEYAKNNGSDKEFLLTPIGTGIAGFTVDEIKSILPDFPENVVKVGQWDE